ncbi:MAG: histone [Candidatus Hodarchaeota archaeon]|jgi:histone H3/H4
MPKAKKKAPEGKTGFAGARVEKIIRDAGAFRVSADAIASLNDIIANRGMEIAKYAVEIAGHSGRKTIKGEDIRLAETKVG